MGGRWEANEAASAAVLIWIDVRLRNEDFDKVFKRYGSWSFRGDSEG